MDSKIEAAPNSRPEADRKEKATTTGRSRRLTRAPLARMVAYSAGGSFEDADLFIGLTELERRPVTTVTLATAKESATLRSSESPMMQAVSRLGLALVLFGCTARHAPDDPPADIPVFVRVQGSCSDARVIDAAGKAEEPAREVGDLPRYETPRSVPGERVRVRANARFPSGDHRNVIGTLAGPAWVLTYGPVKDIEASAGLAAVVAVEDDDGVRCRGYISETVLAPTRSSDG